MAFPEDSEGNRFIVHKRKQVWRMTALVMAAVIAGSLLVWSCAQTKYVPVCSEHGGIKSMTTSDKFDEWSTRDAVCKDGTTQRPVQIEDANGKSHLAVPSER